MNASAVKLSHHELYLKEPIRTLVFTSTLLCHTWWIELFSGQRVGSIWRELQWAKSMAEDCRRMSCFPLYDLNSRPQYEGLGINSTNSVVIPKNLVLRSIVLVWILIYYIEIGLLINFSWTLPQSYFFLGNFLSHNFFLATVLLVWKLNRVLLLFTARNLRRQHFVHKTTGGQPQFSLVLNLFLFKTVSIIWYFFLQSLDGISSPKAKQRRLHQFPDTPPTNLR